MSKSKIDQVVENEGFKSMADFAKDVGVSDPTLTNWRKRGISKSGAAKLKAKYGYTTDSLLDDIAPLSKVTDTRNVSPGPEIKGLVPLISSVQAGQWDEAIDVLEPYEADEVKFCMVPHGPHTYCLKVEGDSMTSPVGRSYPEKSLIFVDPDQRSVMPGDRVIAKRSGENGVTFKQLAKDGDRLYLKPLNPNHPPIFDEFKILGKVIGMWMDE